MSQIMMRICGYAQKVAQIKHSFISLLREGAKTIKKAYKKALKVVKKAKKKIKKNKAFKAMMKFYKKAKGIIVFILIAISLYEILADTSGLWQKLFEVLSLFFL